jgi:Nuclease subunit of the excinuclease complex
MDLKEKVRNLTTSPGIYLMKDSLGGIIYVGKAKNLRNRVRFYFQSSRPHSPKVEKLIKNLKDFDYIVTDTEFEAFMLECKLIKDIKPIYNKKMKSPLSYTYIMVETAMPYPSLEIVSDITGGDGNIYFGPYTNKNTVERAVQGIRECFKIPCCSPAKKSAPCANYSIGSCIGMCMGGPKALQYKDIINRITALFSGTDTGILEEMKKKMLQYSDEFNFETAAKYRDYLDSISFLLSRRNLIEFTEENKNIAVVERLNDSTIKLFLIKGSKLLFSQKYCLEEADKKVFSMVVRASILKYFKRETPDPSMKVTRDEIDEAQIIYSYLKGSSCSHITIPDQWINNDNDPSIDEAISKLMAVI